MWFLPRSPCCGPATSCWRASTSASGIAAARCSARDDARAPGPDQHDRPGVGRQRGVAARPPAARRSPRSREWYATPVQRVLPADTAHPRGADRAGAWRSSTAASATTARWRRRLGRGPSSWARSCPRFAVGRGVRQHGAGGPARRGPRVHRATCSPCSTRTRCSAAWPRCSLFLTHGAVFLALKTTGEVRAAGQRARGAGRLAGRRRGSLAFLAWTQVRPGRRVGTAVLAARRRHCVLVAALQANRDGREGWALHRRPFVTIALAGHHAVRRRYTPR